MIELALNDLFGAPVRRPRRHITKPLRGVQANAGIEAAYRRKLVVMIEEMAKDVRKTLVGDLRDNPPAVVELAQDDLSSTIMRDAIRKLPAGTWHGACWPAVLTPWASRSESPVLDSEPRAQHWHDSDSTFSLRLLRLNLNFKFKLNRLFER